MSVLGSAGSESTPLAGYLPCRPRVLPFLHVETPDVIVIDPTPVPRDQRTTLDKRHASLALRTALVRDVFCGISARR